MSNKFKNNIWWKLLSLLLAIILWVYVINQVDPIKNKKFDNVPVTIRNQEIIENLNQHVTYLKGETVDVTVRGRRTVIDAIKREDVTAVADLSELSITDAVEIKVYFDKDIMDYTCSPTMLQIKREKIRSTSVKVEASLQGNPAKGYVTGEPRIEPNMIEIEGPESKIAQVDKVVVEVDITDATGNVHYPAKPKVLDKDGKEVTEVNKSKEEITVEVPIYKTKEVPLVYDKEGTIPTGYKLVGEEITPKRIKLKGPAEVIDQISRINVGTINLSELTAETTITRSISNNLPSSITLLDETQPIQADIKFSVEQLIPKELSIPMTEINVKNIPEDLQFRFVTTENILLTFEGLAKDINGLTLDDIRVSVNLSNLPVGIHNIEASVNVPYGITLRSPAPRVEIELMEDSFTEAEDATEINE